jgi:hypothetical protein
MKNSKLHVDCIVMGEDAKHGPIYIATMGSTEDGHRLFSSMKWPKDKDKRLQKIKLLAKKVPYFYIHKIPAKDIKEVPIAKAIILSLNSVPRFWENDIRIFADVTPEDLQLSLTVNLKTEKIDCYKWEISIDNIMATPTRMAYLVTEYYYQKEMDYIKQIYGDEVPGFCIHRRD